MSVVRGPLSVDRSSALNPEVMLPQALINSNAAEIEDAVDSKRKYWPPTEPFGPERLDLSHSALGSSPQIFLVVFLSFIGCWTFDPPKADKCLLAYGEFDVHLS